MLDTWAVILISTKGEHRDLAKMYSIEVCAGAGGQALGLEDAGFQHLDLVENDHWACSTLRANRPNWRISECDLQQFEAWKYKGIDLYAGGLPCPPFSVAGKQLGSKDERNLFPIALDQIAVCRPRAVMIENVRGLLDPAFGEYRDWIERTLRKQGFAFVDWRLITACDFGVPQQRPRVILIALRGNAANKFRWPDTKTAPPNVGEALFDLMSARGWTGAKRWKSKAKGIAPAIVGGSKKHGGPDLGPTRARKSWAAMGVDGLGIADEAPSQEFPADAIPKLTPRMIARIQGFPDTWQFAGRKTHACRQIGNAFPPPMANAVGRRILLSLQVATSTLAA
jgi:DNA (cytosine-5)-methyltransferase 1